MDHQAFIMFCAIVAVTLVITFLASRRKQSTSEFYTAGGGLTGWQNGIAIAGDYMSAASFLGIAGLIALKGYDGFFFSIGFLVAYLVVLYLIAEPMRNLGKYTIADAVGARFDSPVLRGVIAISAICISIFYMLAQLSGAGTLIKLLIGSSFWNYQHSVITVGILMTVYVVFGGMRATSWVQIIKAILLMGGTFILSLLVLSHFNFNIITMFHTMATATPLGPKYLNPGNEFTHPIDTVSLTIALLLGTAGLPHILIRFFTVRDAQTARKSVVTATYIIGVFYVMTMLLGFGAASIVHASVIEAANKAGNMAAPLLANKLGGPILFAFISAVAFATILAVVAGLVLSAASAFAHDVYGQLIKKGKASEGEQVMAAKLAALGVAVISIVLGLFVETINVAFLVALCFALAASANLPVLLFTFYWRKFTATGAIIGIVVGLLTGILIVAFGPNVLGPAHKAIIEGQPLSVLKDLRNPGIISIPAGFVAAFIGSLLTRNSVDQTKYDEILYRFTVGEHASAAQTEEAMLSH